MKTASRRPGRGGGGENDGGEQRTVDNLYYDLVTKFFEWGWGRSFHFAPRVPGESFKASLARHERYLSDALELGPGMVAADFGCGIGGPLMEIARHSGAKIVGVNINDYQIGRARELVEKAGLSHLAEFLRCDFTDVDAPDESFDAVYAVEATCHAADLRDVYGEAFRLLKPGARFAAYEYCMTDRFDAQDARHVKIKADIELEGGLLNVDLRHEVDDALRAVGFEVLETRDLSIQDGPSIPWYQPLAGSSISFASFRSSRVGRRFTRYSLRALEACRVAPRGTVSVTDNLGLCASALVEGGRLGVFTPMYFIHARKPG